MHNGNSNNNKKTSLAEQYMLRSYVIFMFLTATVWIRDTPKILYINFNMVNNLPDKNPTNLLFTDNVKRKWFMQINHLTHQVMRWQPAFIIAI